MSAPRASQEDKYHEPGKNRTDGPFGKKAFYGVDYIYRLIEFKR